MMTQKIFKNKSDEEEVLRLKQAVISSHEKAIIFLIKDIVHLHDGGIYIKSITDKFKTDAYKNFMNAINGDLAKLLISTSMILSKQEEKNLIRENSF